ncbi:phenylacetate-CoA oxygenase subunit PaaJ [Aliifodinibius sp. S!AR15-10]|uniref:1,2-phenylacetyl-CoA epoxidase subunit PaaD n=1 Tax=Aliifodinibius sp. S!AR15-10 TaxID=2950437 RepID=UPI00285F589C|nr:1,2-phenylacetyl-CoA epoxidase subunit PaaD [Aliifodinibius sp. S!AR15-10]MDR8393303.1 phenylacetate-CoA oxygenase subunit PaaJ [Aliifodinibius sp. S!AR15-10]
MATTVTYHKEEIWELLENITDPEIPVLNIVEMGIVRSVEIQDEKVVVKITPTYSGCPAMSAIQKEINKTLKEKGIKSFEVKKDFSKTWTTDWMTGEARQKLKDYGIAPPGKTSSGDNVLKELKKTKIIPCPYCESLNTELQSEFGSTPCKSQYYCNDCQEPFEHFKCI